MYKIKTIKSEKVRLLMKDWFLEHFLDRLIVAALVIVIIFGLFLFRHQIWNGICHLSDENNKAIEDLVKSN